MSESLLDRLNHENDVDWLGGNFAYPFLLIIEEQTHRRKEMHCSCWALCDTSEDGDGGIRLREKKKEL